MRRSHRPVFVAVFLGLAATLATAQEPAPPLITTPSVSGLAREIGCAPVAPTTRTAGPIRIIAGRQIRQRQFGTGEAVIVGGGTSQGIRAGDEYFVRRIVEDRYVPQVGGVRDAFPVTTHTAGTLRIVEARADSSIAVITYACDGVLEGDYVEKFEAPKLPETEVGTTPDFDRPGHLILGAERRQVGAAGQFMVLDRGTDHGLKAGQRLTIFRQTVGGSGPVATIGTAKVYLVQPGTSTVRIETSMDAVYVGDLVAIHR